MNYLSLFFLFVVTTFATTLLQAMPIRVIDDIKEQAAKTWPDNYVMRQFEIDQQKASYRKKERLVDAHSGSGSTAERSAFRKIVKSAEATWPDNYTIQVFEIEQQWAAFNALD